MVPLFLIICLIFLFAIYCPFSSLSLYYISCACFWNVSIDVILFRLVLTPVPPGLQPQQPVPMFHLQLLQMQQQQFADQLRKELEAAQARKVIFQIIFSYSFTF
jgi:hypothetical protein